ncbi:MAG TPA: trypsin-like serine protease [Polyangiaceae bacterium]|nr:trypsin-like serine protease [Polyangiaceae bacterium]
MKTLGKIHEHRRGAGPHWLLALAGVATLAGCGAEPGTDSNFDPATALGSASQEVRGGTVYTQAGAWEAIGSIGNCTATLISPYAALTAGHCVTNGTRRTFTLPNARGSIQGTAVQHPFYEAIKWQSHDYALIQFDKSIYETAGVNSSGLTPLPVSSTSFKVGDAVYLAGYGGFGTSCASGSDGKFRYASTTIDEVNEDWHYGMSDPVVGLCPGDSGGPLVVYENNAWRTAGVNSWIAEPWSYVKPTYMAWDWIRENASGPGLPGDTWGHCVMYRDVTSGAYLSVQGNHPSFAAAHDNVASTIWVKKGYRARLFDGQNYVTPLGVHDGYTGSRCNDFGCIYDLSGSTADNKTSSIQCESTLPADTWGWCVGYDRFNNGGYYSVQGDVASFTGANAFWNNRFSQLWIKKGRSAEIFPNPSYAGSPYWTSRKYTGDTGGQCNAYGCLHDLTGTTLERQASSLRCR